MAPLAPAQKPDPALLARIRGVRAIDDHSHPPALPLNGVPDDEYHALPCAPLEPTDPTITGRPENPQFIAAWKALYGYKYDDMNPAHVRVLLAAKARIKKEQGDNYPAWVLEHLGIETELANREAIGHSLLARMVSGEGYVRHGPLAGNAGNRLGGNWVANVELGPRRTGYRSDRNDE